MFLLQLILTGLIKNEKIQEALASLSLTSFFVVSRLLRGYSPIFL
jgi:hypothetical protein